jgi:hypothetical protein
VVAGLVKQEVGSELCYCLEDDKLMFSYVRCDPEHELVPPTLTPKVVADFDATEGFLKEAQQLGSGENHRAANQVTFSRKKSLCDAEGCKFESYPELQLHEELGLKHGFTATVKWSKAAEESDKGLGHSSIILHVPRTTSMAEHDDNLTIPFIKEFWVNVNIIVQEAIKVSKPSGPLRTQVAFHFGSWETEGKEGPCHPHGHVRLGLATYKELAKVCKPLTVPSGSDSFATTLQRMIDDRTLVVNMYNLLKLKEKQRAALAKPAQGWGKGVPKAASQS